MSDAIWLTAAVITTLSGMGWLALSLNVHWRQVTGADAPASTATAGRLRLAGFSALALSLIFCLKADHASMAVLVWIMLLAASAVTVAMTLTWRARLLRVLVFHRPVPSSGPGPRLSNTR